MTAPTKVAIDADIIVYRCGFASKDDEPLEYCLHSVKTTLDRITEQFPNLEECRVLLTGKGNYRDKVAVTKPYKGNRDPNNKPRFYDEIREYLTDYQGAEVIEGMEADDAMGMYQWGHKDKSTCIATIDKDLNCIPGWHYNFVKEEMYYVTLAEANRCFWMQMLTGDTTDNIQGVPKCGPKTAAKILDTTDGSWTEMYARVLQEYERAYPDNPHEVFKEMGTLLWIMRERNKNFDGTPIWEEPDGEEESPEA
jgi:5'-3' exonuclease